MVNGLSSVVQYSYDADGRRIKQMVGSQVTNYLWDEASVYGDVVLETDGSGATIASYVLGDMGIISQSRSGATSYYLQDGQGSTRTLTNAAGSVTDTYSYTAFGELLSQTGSTMNSYLYTGQQFDSLTGLYDLRARYYDPGLGRFLSQDTYPVNFGNPAELNRYAYVGNNPINWTDPTGHYIFVGYAGPTIERAIKTVAVVTAIGLVTAAVIYAVYRLVGTQEATMTWQKMLALEERQSQLARDENPEPTVFPPPWPDLRTPPASTPQPTPTERKYSIVLGHDYELPGFAERYNALPFWTWQKNGITVGDARNKPIVVNELELVAQRAEKIYFVMNGVHTSNVFPVTDIVNRKEVEGQMLIIDYTSYDRDAALQRGLAGVEPLTDWELATLSRHPEWYPKIEFYFDCGYNSGFTGPYKHLGTGTEFLVGANKAGKGQLICAP